MAREINLYPGREQGYEKKKKLIEEHKQLSKRNKELLLDWGRYNQTKGKSSGPYTVSKRWGQLVPITLWLGKDLDKATIKDIQDLQFKIRDNPKWSEDTKADYRRSIKQFYRWLEEEDPRQDSNDPITRNEARKFYRYIDKNVNTKPTKTKKIDPGKVLSPQDLQTLLHKGCSNPQEKAIIQLIHETGARASEIFNVRIKHFTPQPRGLGKIYFPISKTEERVVDILDSVPYLLEHIKQHPWKDEPEEPLFYYIKKLKKKKIRYEPFTHSRVLHLVRRIFKKADVNKPSNPHWFRHSRASLDSTCSHMSPEVRSKRMGWAIGSKQTRVYSHLSNENIREAWLKEKGIVLPEMNQEKEMECSNCKQFIKNTYKACPHCLRPTSKEELEKENSAIRALLEEKDELMELITKYKDPQMQQEFIKTLKEITRLMKDPERLRNFLDPE